MTSLTIVLTSSTREYQNCSINCGTCKMQLIIIIRHLQTGKYANKVKENYNFIADVGFNGSVRGRTLRFRVCPRNATR